MGGVKLFYDTGGEMMLNDVKKKPCAKCPYKLGTVETLINPCPECRLNGYKSYEWFQKQLMGEKKEALED